MRRTFLIDTDTASDDAVALIMALRAPDVDVAAITTVVGNVGVVQATQNALYVTELCGSDVPVYAGASQPLLREHYHAEWFHGKDGLGDHGYPAPSRSAVKIHAADAIVQTVRSNPGLTLVTLGPLTNLALAVTKAPDIVAHVGRCVVMGGNPGTEGNVTPAAEYNMWVDPEAARIVLHAALPIELVGWHLCRGAAVLDALDIEAAMRMGTPLARFAIECNSKAMEAYLTQTGERGISLPDPVAMSIALDPTICLTRSRHYVEVETTSDLTRGMTVVDRLGVAADERNRVVWKQALDRSVPVEVCWTMNTQRWKQALFAALG